MTAIEKITVSCMFGIVYAVLYPVLIAPWLWDCLSYLGLY